MRGNNVCSETRMMNSPSLTRHPMHIYWGELHDNTYQYDNLPFPFEESVRRARSHLDFYGAAYYTARTTVHRTSSPDGKPIGFNLEGWKPIEQIEREWGEVREVCRAANDPDRFVTFPGYEWQGNGSSGDHNVFSQDDDLPVFHADTLTELYNALRGRDVIAIPHHTGYQIGMRGRDWSVYDERFTPFTEIFSCHGSSEIDEEWIGLRHNRHMGPGTAGGTWQDALNRGYHLGAIGSTDNWGKMPGHYGRGLAAVLATTLTRKAVWDAFRARRVYAVTGDRIELDFRVNGAEMGRVIESDGPRRIEVRVSGWDAIDRIEILRGEQVIATHCHQGTWSAPRAGQRSRFRLRIEAGWGPRAQEIPCTAQDWHGTLTMDGGRIVDWRPCWIGPGQEAVLAGPNRATFRLRTQQDDVATEPQNAIVWEIEGTPESRMHLTLNSRTVSATLAELAAGSRVLWFKDECVAMLNQAAGVPPLAPERMDIYYHLAHKVKIHLAMPEAACTAAMTIEDETPIEQETHYRVRVEQRNGQRAWSSPVWVRGKAT